jgi:hypothetical protein
MIESHRDVRAQLPLDLDRAFGSESPKGPIDMTLELDAVLLDPAQPFEREDLKSTGIGQHGAVPGGEPVQPSHGLDHALTRPQVQVVGIAQNDLGAGAANVPRAQPSDDSVSTHWHERRSPDLTMG